MKESVFIMDGTAYELHKKLKKIIKKDGIGKYKLSGDISEIRALNQLKNADYIHIITENAREITYSLTNPKDDDNTNQSSI